MNTTQTNHSNASSASSPITWKDVVTGAKAKRMDAHTHEIVAEIIAAPDSKALFTALAETPNAGVLIKTAGNDNPFIIHNPSWAKGSRLTGDAGRDFPFVLEGTDSKEATAYGIMPDQFFVMTAPRGLMKYSDLLEIQDLASFAGVNEAAATRNAQTLSIRNVAFVPAFLLEALLDKPEFTTAVEMAAIIAVTIKDRLLANASTIEIPEDDEEGNVDPAATAETAALARTRISSDEEIIAVGGQVLVWLKYFMMEGVLSEVNLLPATRRSTIGSAAKMLHLQHFPEKVTTFADTQNPNQDPQQRELMNIMTRQLQVSAEAVENMATINSSFADKNGENPPKGFSKLSKVLRKTLLAAGTVDGFLPIDDIEEMGKEIFAAKSDSDVHLQLETNLKQKGFYFASISTAVAKQIGKGLWQWPSHLIPGGISCLVTPSWNPDAQSLAHQTLVLSVKTSHQMDASSLKKLTESETVLPRTTKEFFNVLKIKKGLLEMFFPEESLAVREHDAFIDGLQSIQAELEVGLMHDKDYLTRILYISDSRFNKWLNQCAIWPENLNRINHHLIKFSDIIADIQCLKFGKVALPPSFMHLKRDLESSSDATSEILKKQKLAESTKVSDQIVKNTADRPAEWKLKDGEVYTTVFSGNDKLSKRPDKLCPRFWIKGHCFANCHRDHSVTLTSCDRKAMTKFVKFCRGNE